MPRKIWSTALTLGLLATAASAQEIACSGLKEGGAANLQKAYDCIAAYESKISKLEGSVLAARQQYSSDIEELRALFKAEVERTTANQTADALQLRSSLDQFAGAFKFSVVAFDRSEAFGACPRGWSPFEPAGGRMIVGAGRHNNGLKEYPSFSDKPNDAIGGAETVTLIAAQMPKHVHKFGFWFSDTDGDDVTYDNTKIPRFRSGLNTNNRWIADTTRTPIAETGGDQPHNNMPPYIALYFCKKD